MNTVQEWLCRNASWQEASAAFTQAGKYAIYGLSGSQKTFLLGQAMAAESGPWVIVVHDKAHKEIWERDMALWRPEVPVYSYPITDDAVFEATARSMELQAKQMQALSACLAQKNCIVIATAEEASQRVIDPDILKEFVHVWREGEDVDLKQLLTDWVQSGYERVDQVEQRGHFSVRGDIIDIFPVNEETPYRIELFGDTIDRICSFSVDTQRSIDRCESCTIVPFRLTQEERSSSLLSYAEAAHVILDEPSRIQEAMQAYLKEDKTHEAQHMSWREWIGTLTSKHVVAFTFLQKRSLGIGSVTSIGVQAKSMQSFERQMPLLMDEIVHWVGQGRQVALVVHNQQRLEATQRALLSAGIPAEVCPAITLTAPKVCIVQGLVSDGFELPASQFVVVTEKNIFGQQKKRLRKKAAKGQQINYFTDLTPGDYVVHAAQGIGKYMGLKTIELEGVRKDYVEIAYAGADRLYLPVDNLDSLQKYIGNEGETPKIHKMGGVEWQKTKVKAQKSIDQLAEKLVTLYAEREMVQGFAFLPDQPWQQEFEDAFPYEETEDQLQAVRDIKRAMEDPHPMDCLLCGDVGFGKTEVAMRAIFKAVMSGKQVAVLVPTTVLAQQHFQTFRERFQSFGVTVEVINRFRSVAEKRDILQRLAMGQVDVLIGTHSLLNKKVQFKDLGLLVVDEEQRFGVAQKEKWKSWASHIDVLTLSATPIPRTLHMSLVGVRTMCVINTPPEDRLPIQTYVVEYDMGLIVDAIRRELQRGGQIYFVYNRVASITRMAELLEAAMPDLRFAIAHGQMTGPQMEKIMVDFYEGHYDLLLCTSIIETGLDIPNANTIIIYDADRLGLSQLYQMRGRVGRSRRRAYAYFMYRPDKMLSEAAEKRLKAIEEFTALGAGFKLAMRDLEIRGAGNLLGAQQHGNIASVGFALYCSMLEEAIRKAKHEALEAPPPPDPILDLGVEAYIDEGYIGDSARKIAMYQRFLQVKNEEALNDLVDEMIDRFGEPSESVAQLIELARLKERCRLLGIKSMVLRGDVITVIWNRPEAVAAWDMASVSQPAWRRMKLSENPPTLRYRVSDLPGTAVQWAQGLLKELEKREDSHE